MFKSGRFSRVHVKVPGGRTVLRFKEKTPKQPHCGECGKPLPGIPRMSRVEATHASKSSKRPQRPFGGVLCSACTRKRLVAKARV